MRGGTLLALVLVMGACRRELPKQMEDSDVEVGGFDDDTDVEPDTDEDSPIDSDPVVDTDPPNDPPVATSMTVQTQEDTDLSVLMQATDADGDRLSWRVVRLPDLGFIEGDGPGYVYRPRPDAHGLDRVEMEVSDGRHVVTTWLDVEILPVNDAPTLAAAAFDVPHDTAVDLTLSAQDVDGDTLVWTVLESPFTGQLLGAGPHFVFVPEDGAEGDDSFLVEVSDGVESAQARIQLTIAPDPRSGINDPPIATSEVVSTDEDLPVAVLLQGRDPEGEPLSYVLVDPPAFGSLSGTPPSLVYLPDPDHHGVDQLTFRVSDGVHTSGLGTVELQVAPVNDLPEPAITSVTGLEDRELDIVLSATDADGDALVYALATNPSHGELDGVPPNLVYTPNPDFHGQDSFTWAVSDGVDWVLDQAVAIEILPADDRPRALGQQHTLDEDDGIDLLLTALDAETDDLTYEIVTQPAGGMLTGTAPALRYVPDPDLHGEDSFQFRAFDGTHWSEPAEVLLTIRPVNDAPVAQPLEVRTPEDVAVDLSPLASDVDGDALIWNLTPPRSGTLTGSGPQWTYVPDPDAHGTEVLQLLVSDGVATSMPVDVRIVVEPTPDPPVARSEVLVGDEDTALSIRLRGSDPDGDTLAFRLLQQPTTGTLSGSAPNLVYTPATEWSGTEQLEFEVDDGSATATGIIELQIQPVPDRPVAVPSMWTTEQDSSVDILLEGTDADGDALTFRIVTAPEHGTLTGSPPAVEYAADPGFVGQDQFTFVAHDGGLGSQPASVDIEVLSTTRPPEVLPLSFDAVGGVLRELGADDGVLAGAFDPDGTSVQVVDAQVTSTFGVVVSLGTDGSLSYEAPRGHGGEVDAFSVLVRDGQGEETVASVAVQLLADAWFVDNTAGGDGSRDTPFATLAEAESASGPGDVIAVRPGDGTSLGLDTPLTLQQGQRLCGMSVDCAVGGVLVDPASAAPVLTGTLTMAEGSVAQGLILDGAQVTGTDCTSVTLAHMTVRNSAASAIELTRVDGVSLTELTVSGGSTDGLVLDHVRAAQVHRMNISNIAGVGVRIISPRGDNDLTFLEATTVGTGLVLTEQDQEGRWTVDVEDSRVTMASTGVVMDFSDDSADREWIDIERSTFDTISGHGVHIQSRNAHGAGRHVDIDVVDCVFTGVGGAPVEVETRDTSKLDLRVLRDEVLDGTQGVHVVSWDASTVVLDLIELELYSTATGVESVARGTSTQVMRFRDSDVTSAVGVSVLVEDDTTAELAVHDNDFGADAMLLSSVSAAPAARLQADVYDNEAVGAYRLDAPDFFSLGYWTLELALPNPPGVVYGDEDGGILETRGNTTAGGPPIVVVTGSVSTIDPVEIALP